MPNKYKHIAVGLAVALLGTAAVGQEFTQHRGVKTVYAAQGGAVKTVEGIDFWTDGAPDKPFVVIGYITDDLAASGLVGGFQQSRMPGKFAAIAKENGGDALINMQDETRVVGTVSGTYGNAHTTGNATWNGTANHSGNQTNVHSNGYANANTWGWASTGTSAVSRRTVKMAVVKYVDPAAAAPAADSGLTARQQ